MKTKKLCSLIMALAMTLALAVPALADNAADGVTQNVAVGASTTVGAINITVGATGTIVLNPYQMKATTGNSDTTGSYHQIYFTPVSCVNKSTYGLKVNAVITGTEVGDAKFVATAPKDTTTTKDVFLYAEFGVSDSDTTQPEWATEYNKSNANQVLVSASASTSKTVATLNATNGPSATGDAQNWNYLWYKFDGAVAKSPTESWTTGDNVTAAVALTLVPTVDTIYNVNLTNTVSKTAAGTAVLNYDIAPAGVTISVACTADATLGGTPTVTAKQGTTSLTVEGDGPYTFTMPAGDVDVTVKWTA